MEKKSEMWDVGREVWDVGELLLGDFYTLHPIPCTQPLRFREVIY